MVTIGKVKVLKYYPYRSARVVGERTSIPREFVRSVEEDLANLAGVPAGNHVCYLVDFGNGQTPKAIQFTDFWMFYGDEIEEKAW